MKALLVALLLVFFSSSSSLAASYGGGSIGSAERKRPNILLITMDDIGWDAFSYSGASSPLLSASTPNIDAIMADGVLFKHGQAQTWCVPTRFELLTGQDGITSKGTQDNPAGYDWGTPNMTNYLADDGVYRVYGVGKHGVLGDGSFWAGRFANLGHSVGGTKNSKYGFDRALMWPKSVANNEYWCLTKVLWSDEGVDKDGYDDPWPGNLSVTHGNDLSFGTCAANLTDFHYIWADNTWNSNGMKYIQDHYSGIHQDRPWFMWLSYSGPHKPHTLHAGNGTPANPTTSIPYAGYLGPASLANSCGTDPASPTSIDCFVAMIENVDFQIGQFLANLTTAQKAQTLIILHGDNGSDFLDTGIALDHNKATNCPNSTCVFDDFVTNSTFPPLSFSIGVGKGTISHTGTGVPFVISGGPVANVNRGTTTVAAVGGRDINETVLQTAISGFTRNPSYPVKFTSDMLSPLKNLNCGLTPNPCDDISKYAYTLGTTTVAGVPRALVHSGQAMLDNEGFKYYENADQMYNLITDPKEATPLCGSVASTCTATPPSSGAAVTALAGLKAQLALY